MPGDELVDRSAFNATRAVTVDARPEEVWPWIVQMGFGRAGWYYRDGISRRGRDSSRELLPDYQIPEIGDLVPLIPDGKRGLRVIGFDRHKWMLWGDGKGRVTWSWSLLPVAGGTRLVTRLRIRRDWRPPQVFFHLALEAGDALMIRKCMLGIKERAEAVSARNRDGVGMIADLLALSMHSA